MRLAPALLCLPLTSCVLAVRPLAFDFSDESPEQALAHSMEALEGAYAFTEWKGIDWAAVHARLAAEPDWDRAVRRLVEELPDGHVLLEHDTAGLCPEAAGTTGLLFSDTDAGELIVVRAAPETGVEAGDVLLQWEGLDVETALAEQPLFCFPVGLATLERRRVARVRLLSRGEVGADRQLLLAREGVPYEVSLPLEADPQDPREALGLTLPATRVTSEMLSADTGYIAVGWEETAISDAAVGRALRRLWAEGARKLVLDLRDNDGGTDQTAANIVGFFTDREWFYETITMYDRRLGGQAPISEVWVSPQEVAWELPLVVLVNGNTVSSGEGMAMMFARLEGVEVVGFEGTAASFGSSGSTIELPGGWTLTWPAGRSLDEAGRIQLDSDDTLTGGVAPTHRIPWTAEARLAWAEDPHGFEVDYALGLLESR